MINIWIILSILFVHWIADFLCQTSYMAQNKSKSWPPLLLHTGTYTLVWAIPTAVLFKAHLIGLIFLLITFISHTATDYVTSRVNSKLWEEKKIHWFFVSVGGDQLAHYIQLFLTYYLLTKN